MIKSQPKMRESILLIISILSSVSALYTPSSEVIIIHGPTFKEQVEDSSDIWLVEYYNPECFHCRTFSTEYSKIAKAFQGIIKVGAIDIKAHEKIMEDHTIKSVPTIKLYLVKGQLPLIYDGPNSADKVVDFVMKHLKKLVNSKIGRLPEGDVIKLTDKNFESTVLDSKDMWLVEFYAPWCGHCKKLAPVWTEAAKALKGKVRLGALDATINVNMANKYKIQGYPTIKFFDAGKKTESSVLDYQGGRSTAEIVDWALDKFKENIPDPRISEITDAEVLLEECESARLCIISFLPHLLDCQSECRYSYLDVLRDASRKFKLEQWGWVWVEAKAQEELENVLNIGDSGYPTMVVVNIKKMRMARLTGPFDLNGVSEFLKSTKFGKSSNAVQIRAERMPRIVHTEPWNGKDMPEPGTEDYKDEL